MDSLACLVTFGVSALAVVSVAWRRIRAEAHAAATRRPQALHGAPTKE